MEMIMDAAIELGAEDVVNVEEDDITEEENAGGNASSKEDPRRETEVEVGLLLNQLLSRLTDNKHRLWHLQNC